MLCDDKFATSVKTEILAVGNENQSDEFAFLLLLIGSSDENNSDTKISFWCWKTLSGKMTWSCWHCVFVSLLIPAHP